MIIAIPLDENKKDVCVSFGRAPYFMIHKTESNTSEIIDNPAESAPSGAGIKAAQVLIDSGVTVLITVRCGENAAEVLKGADIIIYKSQSVNAAENLVALKEGKLEVLTNFHASFQGIQ